MGPDDGDGALQELEAARNRLRLERMVVVPHGLWGSEKAQVLADADAFCLPSATENFGIAPAEAAGVGLPVVLSAECGVVEFLDDASTEIIDEADVSAVAEGIERALKQQARIAARSSSSGVRDRLDWGRLAQLQVAIYQRALSGSGQAVSS